MMSSRKQRPPRRGNVVTGPFQKRKPKPKPNPVEDPKPSSGIDVKQLMLVGGVTALTGTIVGAVAMEIYRHLRPKIPIPMPGQQGQVTQNPGYPQTEPQLPLGWAPQPQPNYGMPQAPAFVPTAVQQVGAFPPQQALPPPAYPPAYAPAPMALAPAYQNPAPAPQAAPQPQSVPISPQPPSQADAHREPLSRPELAQWQRRLEGWERNLDRRQSYGES